LDARSRCGCCESGIDVPFASAQAAACEHNYAVALVEPGDDRDFRLKSIESLRAGSVDGLLFFVAPPLPEDVIKALGPWC
jgi:hypothetical protein